MGSYSKFDSAGKYIYSIGISYKVTTMASLISRSRLLCIFIFFFVLVIFFLSKTLNLRTVWLQVFYSPL